MIRCLSCDGILTKDEKTCYTCGDPAPPQVKSAQNFVPLLLAAGLILSVGFTAYSFWSGAPRDPPVSARSCLLNDLVSQPPRDVAFHVRAVGSVDHGETRAATASSIAVRSSLPSMAILSTVRAIASSRSFDGLIGINGMEADFARDCIRNNIGHPSSGGPLEVRGSFRSHSRHFPCRRLRPAG